MRRRRPRGLEGKVAPPCAGNAAWCWPAASRLRVPSTIYSGRGGCFASSGLRVSARAPCSGAGKHLGRRLPHRVQPHLAGHGERPREHRPGAFRHDAGVGRDGRSRRQNNRQHDLHAHERRRKSAQHPRSRTARPADLAYYVDLLRRTRARGQDPRERSEPAHRPARAPRRCPADAGRGLGAFEDTKGMEPAAFAEALKGDALRTFGTAGPAFVESSRGTGPR